MPNPQIISSITTFTYSDGSSGSIVHSKEVNEMINQISSKMHEITGKELKTLIKNNDVYHLQHETVQGDKSE